MASSEKLIERYFNIIEKTLQDTIANENTKTLLREYKDFLLDELEIQKENEKILQGNLDKLTSIKDSTLEVNCFKLQEKINDSEKYIKQLRDEMDNLIIQTMADNETLKMESAEKEQQIISYYDAEVVKFKKQLENNEKEQKKIEQELKNQITLEFATRKARLGEIRSNLQRQMVEKNSVLIKMQNEHKELSKELNKLKTQEKSITNQYNNVNPRSNVMEFHNDFLIQKNLTNVSVNRNEFINRPPRLTSTISEYNITEPENQNYLEFANSCLGLAASNFGQPNIGLNQQTIYNNQNYITKVENNQQLLLNDNISSVSNRPTKNQTNNNSVKPNQLTNQERAYLVEDYDQFNDIFINSPPNIDTVSAKILEQEQNSTSVVKTSGSNPFIRNNKHDSTPAMKKSKVDAPRSSMQNTIISPKHNDSLMIEDPDIFDQDLATNTEPFDYDRNPSDVPRKGPTVYVGETRRNKTYTKTQGSKLKENYGGKGKLWG